MTDPYNAGHSWRDAVEGALEFILEGLAIVLVLADCHQCGAPFLACTPALCGDHA